ncbi:hypothetical protein WUBG_11010, partial [Wuchereria bancrofti]
MTGFHCLLLRLLLWYAVLLTDGYRLNVPRVLLPYHPSVQVTFDLIVSDPANGCFTWRSTRPDTVSVKGVNPVGTKGCSAKAQITATSKYAEEQMAVVFAEDKDAGVVLSCSVTVDVIRSISVSTTTKVLFWMPHQQKSLYKHTMLKVICSLTWEKFLLNGILNHHLYPKNPFELYHFRSQNMKLLMACVYLKKIKT